MPLPRKTSGRANAGSAPMARSGLPYQQSGMPHPREPTNSQFVTLVQGMAILFLWMSLKGPLHVTLTCGYRRLPLYRSVRGSLAAASEVGWLPMLRAGLVPQLCPIVIKFALTCMGNPPRASLRRTHKNPNASADLVS